MNKYRNVRTAVDGIVFQSKKEAKYYVYLKGLERAQLVKFSIQVPFVFPSGIKYIADFVEMWPDGRKVITDCKGFKTAVYRLKKKLMKYHYNVEINEV